MNEWRRRWTWPRRRAFCLFWSGLGRRVGFAFFREIGQNRFGSKIVDVFNASGPFFGGMLSANVSRNSRFSHVQVRDFGGFNRLLEDALGRGRREAFDFRASGRDKLYWDEGAIWFEYRECVSISPVGLGSVRTESSSSKVWVWIDGRIRRFILLSKCCSKSPAFP
jgi:hypothetical protein